MRNPKRHAGQAGTDFLLGTLAVLLILSFIAGLFWTWPKYNLYCATVAGEAELSQASYNRQIQVNDAESKAKAATMLAKAEVERAKGVAQANKIIGASLNENEAYLRYLWIDKMASDKEVVYVPTEAGLPILEANRLTAAAASRGTKK